ncbi:MAG TPA: helix-turn-helix transcriptional regulator [Ktedonobacteraceae bacterium]|nr:helix-turn-helix transcriptional regulator [Ktedonobacteraceae bacterium]
MPYDPSQQNIGQSVGAKIRAARIAKKYTQSHLAQPDFSVSYISAIERGQIHPSLRALEILANRLGLSSADFLPDASSNNSHAEAAANEATRNAADIEIQLLEAQIAIWQGAAQSAIAQLRKLTSRELTVRQEIQLHYLLGWAYSIASQFQEGESALSEALHLIKDPNDHMGLQILNLLGNVYAAMHNYAQGLQAHQQSLDMLENMQPLNPFLMAQVYMNMGLHYTYLSRFQQAIEMFQRALTLTEAVSHPDQLRSLYLHLFQHYKEIEDYQQATLYGYKLMQVSSEEYSQSLKSGLYYYLGRAMLRGNRQSALAYLEKTLAQVEAMQDQLVLATVTGQYAQWLLENDQLAEAQEQAEKALVLASQYEDTMMKAEALMTLGKIAYAQKASETGDGHFVAALQMLEQLKALEELADGCAMYAQLLEEHGKMNEAFNYMKQAFAARRRMQVYTSE